MNGSAGVINGTFGFLWKTCRQCGEQFKTKRISKVYCSNRCKTRFCLDSKEHKKRLELRAEIICRNMTHMKQELEDKGLHPFGCNCDDCAPTGRESREARL